MITLPSSASKSSTEWAHLRELPRDFLGDLLEQAVGRFLDCVLRGACDALAGLAGQVEGVPGRLAHRPPLDDSQADRTVLADHPPGIVVGAAGGDPDDVEIELAAEIGRHAGNRVDRPMDDRELEPPPQDRVGALLGGGRRVLERDPGGGDHLDGLVVNRLAACPAVFQSEIDLDEIESDRQRVRQPMNRPRQLRADSVAQKFRHWVGGTHERQSLRTRVTSRASRPSVDRAARLACTVNRAEPVVRGPGRQRIADCTEQSAKSSNLMPNATNSARPLGSTPQRDVY